MKLTLMKFGAKWCGPCAALAKAKTLEKFAAAHPEVKVERHDDTLHGTDAWNDLADEWGVKNVPTLIWVADGKVLFRSSDVSPAGIEKQLARAVRAGVG